jgi:hypothetical protein
MDINEWNLYYCGLCGVDFAIRKMTDKGGSSCPKCESGEDVYLLPKPKNAAMDQEGKKKESRFKWLLRNGFTPEQADKIVNAYDYVSKGDKQE